MVEQDAAPNHGHYPALDGLRALAVSLVVLFHVVPGLLPHGVMAFGQFGVDLFFVLSGFLITGILLDTIGSVGYYRNFMVRRALRILPLSYGVLATVFLIAAVTDHPDLRATAAGQPWFWAYLQNLWFAFEGWPKDLGYLNHFWSLAVEEQFYLLWPLVVMWVPRRRLPGLLLAALCMGPLVRAIRPDMPFAFAFSLSRLDGLLLGALVAWTLRERHDLLAKCWRPLGFAALLAAAALAIVLARSGNTDDPVIVLWAPFAFSLLWAALLVGILDRSMVGGGLLRTLFSWPPLRMIGRYSYGIYVFHWPLMLLRPALVGVLVQHGWSEVVATRSVLVAYFPVVFAVSAASYHLWELPFLRLKDRWAPRP